MKRMHRYSWQVCDFSLPFGISKLRFIVHRRYGTHQGIQLHSGSGGLQIRPFPLPSSPGRTSRQSSVNADSQSSTQSSTSLNEVLEARCATEARFNDFVLPQDLKGEWYQYYRVYSSLWKSLSRETGSSSSTVETSKFKGLLEGLCSGFDNSGSNLLKRSAQLAAAAFVGPRHAQVFPRDKFVFEKEFACSLRSCPGPVIALAAEQLCRIGDESVHILIPALQHRLIECSTASLVAVLRCFAAHSVGLELCLIIIRLLALTSLHANQILDVLEVISFLPFSEASTIDTFVQLLIYSRRVDAALKESRFRRAPDVDLDLFCRRLTSTLSVLLDTARVTDLELDVRCRQVFAQLTKAPNSTVRNRLRRDSHQSIHSRSSRLLAVDRDLLLCSMSQDQDSSQLRLKQTVRNLSMNPIPPRVFLNHLSSQRRKGKNCLSAITTCALGHLPKLTDPASLELLWGSVEVWWPEALAAVGTVGWKEGEPRIENNPMVSMLRFETLRMTHLLSDKTLRVVYDCLWSSQISRAHPITAFTIRFLELQLCARGISIRNGLPLTDPIAFLFMANEAPYQCRIPCTPTSTCPGSPSEPDAIDLMVSCKYRRIVSTFIVTYAMHAVGSVTSPAVLGALYDTIRSLVTHSTATVPAQLSRLLQMLSRSHQDHILNVLERQWDPQLPGQKLLRSPFNGGHRCKPSEVLFDRVCELDPMTETVWLLDFLSVKRLGFFLKNFAPSARGAARVALVRNPRVEVLEICEGMTMYDLDSALQLSRSVFCHEPVVFPQPEGDGQILGLISRFQSSNFSLLLAQTASHFTATAGSSTARKFQQLALVGLAFAYNRSSENWTHEWPGWVCPAISESLIHVLCHRSFQDLDPKIVFLARMAADILIMKDGPSEESYGAIGRSFDCIQGTAPPGPDSRNFQWECVVASLRTVYCKVLETFLLTTLRKQFGSSTVETVSSLLTLLSERNAEENRDELKCACVKRLVALPRTVRDG